MVLEKIKKGKIYLNVLTDWDCIDCIGIHAIRRKCLIRNITEGERMEDDENKLGDSYE